MDSNKRAILILYCEKRIWKQFSEGNQPPVPSATLFQTSGSYFEAWISPLSSVNPMLPSQARRGAMALWERPECLLRQGFSSTQVRPGQPALHGKSWSEPSSSHQECKEGGRAMTGSAQMKVSFLAADMSLCSPSLQPLITFTLNHSTDHLQMPTSLSIHLPDLPACWG